MARPILCFDMDGTLLDDHGQIHPGDLAILANPDPPALLIPTTGRPLASIRHTFTQNGLFVDRPIPLPLVLLNGSQLYLPGEIEVAYTPLPPEVGVRLLALAAAFPQVTFFYLGREAIKTLNLMPFGMNIADQYEIPFRPLEAPGPDFVLSKVMCVSETPGSLAEIEAWSRSLPIEGTYSMATIFEINPQGISKGRGVRRLLREFGLEGQPFLAAGDGENDRVLLETAAVTFAPATAPPEIRALAAHVIDVGRHGLLAPMLDYL